MKLPVLLRRFVALATFTTGVVFAQVEPPQPPLPEGGGLSVSLTPGGYKFVVPTAGALRRGANAKTSFPASVALSNRSRHTVAFNFPDAASAESKWTFRVFDEDGSEVWKSDSGLGALVLTEKKLVPGQTWRRLVQVPLRPNDQALAPGVYTLEASLDADKKLGASTIFEVVQGDQPPEPPKQGIAGLVLRPADPPTEPASEAPAAGAFVQVQQILLNVPPGSPPPFVWTGRADDAGKFSVSTPAGRFRVTAGLGNVGTVVLPPKTIEVTVEEGKFSDVVIHLTAQPPPPPGQGIRGLVLANSAAGVAVPVAYAGILVEQLANDANNVLFRWSGRTNNEGRFEVPTPVGRFKVTATFPPPTPGVVVPPPPPVVIEVGVEAGVVRQVTLQFVNGNTP